MRTWLIVFLASFLTCGLFAEEKSAAPEAAAKAFYETLLRLKPQGLPNEAQMKELSPMLHEDLAKLIAKAGAEQKEFIRKNPDEKPPFIEGNLFGSSYEGMHTFKLAAPLVHGDRATVPVYLEYKEGETVVRWVDVLILARVGAEWRVWEIFLTAPWDFRAGPSLRAALAEE
jgi:hypothetical protein